MASLQQKLFISAFFTYFYVPSLIKKMTHFVKIILFHCICTNKQFSRVTRTVFWPLGDFSFGASRQNSGDDPERPQNKRPPPMCQHYDRIWPWWDKSSLDCFSHGHFFFATLCIMFKSQWFHSTDTWHLYITRAPTKQLFVVLWVGFKCLVQLIYCTWCRENYRPVAVMK